MYDSTFTVIINHCEGSCISKNSVLVIHKILRLFVNILTGDYKSYLFNRDKLAQPIQMKLSQKQKAFSEYFFAFLKSILNFKYLPKKGDPHT